MFNAAYVHKQKNEKHWSQIKQDVIYISGDRENISIWSKFEDLDSLINSPLWLEPCDLEEPVHAKGGDYCPLCTCDTTHWRIREIFEWGHCKDCIVVHCDEKYESDYTGRDYTIITEVNNRPVIFSYWNKPNYQTNKYIDEVDSYLQKINEKIGIRRWYKKKYIDESPETRRKQQIAWEKEWEKEKKRREEEEAEYRQFTENFGPPVTRYYKRDENGNMVEIVENC